MKKGKKELVMSGRLMRPLVVGQSASMRTGRYAIPCP